MVGSEHSSLMECGVFEDIPDEAVRELCARGRDLSFEAGVTLFDRGGRADELMILNEGVVELLFPVQIMGVTRGVTMESKHAGDVVAWSSLVSPFQFTLSARCATACTLTSFTREALHDYFAINPPTGYLFMRNVAGVIGRRLQAMQTMWMHDLEARAVERLE